MFDFEVLVNIQENIVDASIDAAREDGDRVYYYLYLFNGEVVQKSGWKKEFSYSFVLPQTDRYFIKAYVERNGGKVVKKSNYFDYISMADREEFENFCNQEMSYGDVRGINPWHLYHRHHPYNDFCFIDGRVQENRMDELCNEFDFAMERCSLGKERSGLLIKERRLNFRQDEICFSGIGKITERLIVGNANISEDIKEQELSEGLGVFTYCQKKKLGIEIGTDYFGVGKIYYFQDEKNFVCGNNYHMLLIILRYLDKKLSIHEEMVNAMLCKMNQPFQQRFSRECEVKGVYILPVGKKIIFDDKTVIEDTEISKAFELPKEIPEEEYVSVLKAGVQEILDNAEVALNSKQYDRYMVELTGGLDSRIVYSALTNLRTADKEIWVNTIKGEENSKDLDIATKVNSVYKFPWYSCKKTIIRRVYRELQNDIYSHFLLGGYYFPLERLPANYDIVSDNVEGEENVLSLNGFFGEICCRPYFTRSLLNKYSDIEKYNIEQIVPLIVNQKDILSMRTHNALCDVIKRELTLLPGRSSVEKYETHYLFYRNSFHISKVREYENRGAWGILQSKKLYQLCRKMYYQKKDIKVQLDVINMLNPILGGIPYEAEADNLAKDNLKKELYHSDEKYRNILLNLESNLTAYEEAFKEKENGKSYTSGNDLTLEENDKENKEWIENWKQRFEQILHMLMRYNNGLFKEQYGIDVFVSFLIKKDKTEAYYKILYNKLVALYLQLRVIDDEYNEFFL